MAEWDTHPNESLGDNTPETYLKQIEQELESLERKKEYLLSERERIERESFDYRELQ